MTTIAEARETMQEAGYEWDGLEEHLEQWEGLLRHERLLVVPPGEIFDATDYLEVRGLSTERLTVAFAGKA